VSDSGREGELVGELKLEGWIDVVYLITPDEMGLEGENIIVSFLESRLRGEVVRSEVSTDFGRALPQVSSFVIGTENP